MGRPFIEFIHPDDINPTKNAVGHLQVGRNISTFENRYRHKDGTYRWLLWTSASDVKNQLIYASAVDITERKKSEDELLRRIEQAAKYVPIENLALSTQCGFASAASGNLLSWDDMCRKLELVAKVARRAWG